MGWVENLKRFGLNGTVDLSMNRVGSIGAGQLSDLLAYNSTVESLVCLLQTCALIHELVPCRLLAIFPLSSLFSHVLPVWSFGVSLTICLRRWHMSLQDLRETILGPEGATHLARMLKTNTHLVTLDLASNAIEDKGATALAGVLDNRLHDFCGFSRLECVCSCLSLFVCCAACPQSRFTINHINLHKHTHTNPHVCTWTEAIKLNTVLVKLELQRNGISSEGALHIAEALRVNTSLEYLGFAFNGFGDKGATHLADVLKGEDVSVYVWFRIATSREYVGVASTAVGIQGHVRTNVRSGSYFKPCCGCV